MSDAAYLACSGYSQAVQAVLTDYQYIEEGSRMYATYAYGLIRAKVAPDLPFKYSYSDTDKDALGKLIGRFEKLSNREDLTKELKDLVRHRNEVAHKAFLLSSDKQKDPAYLDAEAADLTKLRQRTGPLVEA